MTITCNLEIWKESDFTQEEKEEIEAQVNIMCATIERLGHVHYKLSADGKP